MSSSCWCKQIGSDHAFLLARCSPFHSATSKGECANVENIDAFDTLFYLQSVPARYDDRAKYSGPRCTRAKDSFPFAYGVGHEANLVVPLLHSVRHMPAMYLCPYRSPVSMKDPAVHATSSRLLLRSASPHSTSRSCGSDTGARIWDKSRSLSTASCLGLSAAIAALFILLLGR